MTPETVLVLDRARDCLRDARRIAALPIPHVAAREAYLAVFHAAQAFILERSGRVVKTHTGVRSEFARLTQGKTSIGREVTRFLAISFEMKTIADYGTRHEGNIPPEKALAAIATAERLIGAVVELIGRTDEGG